MENLVKKIVTNALETKDVILLVNVRITLTIVKMNHILETIVIKNAVKKIVKHAIEKENV